MLLIIWHLTTEIEIAYLSDKISLHKNASLSVANIRFHKQVFGYQDIANWNLRLAAIMYTGLRNVPGPFLLKRGGGVATI